MAIANLVVTGNITLLQSIPFSGGGGGSGVLSVRVTQDSNPSNTFVFSELSATDLGDYVDPMGQFTQGCLRANTGNTSLFPNYYVFFRKDKNGTPRNEIVFEYGAVFNGQKSNMSSYHASIMIDGVETANIAVPYHLHWSRWRWNPTPRPIRQTGAQLIANNMVPPLSTVYTKGVTDAPTLPGLAPAVYSGPMSLASLDPYQPDVGGRPDIGMITEHQAYYICTGLAGANVLAQGEASGSFNWHHRDENTGAPLNKTTYNQASRDSQNSPNPYLQVPTGGTLLALGLPNMQCDIAHHPSLAAVPFMMTGDPYYLEEHQFITNFTIFGQNWTYRAITGAGGTILETGGEFLAIRASGWMCRTAAQALKITPASTPSWLLPQSYFQTFNDQLIAYFNNRKTPGARPLYDLFRTIERQFGDQSDIGLYPGGDIYAGTYGQVYMEDYVANAWSYAGWMLPTSGWIALANWKRVSSIARANGASGWENAEPMPYRILYRSSNTLPAYTGYTTWNDSWVATNNIFQFAYTSGVLDVGNATVVDYDCYNRSSLAWGMIYGDGVSNSAYAYMNTALMAAFSQSKPCHWQWAVDPTAILSF